MPRAYVLIQTDPDKRDAVRNALGRLSMNKALVEELWGNELVAHVDGHDVDSLTDALTRQVPAIDGVVRIAVWTIALGS
jgi:nitrate reductase NapAB chaperone NapD